MNLLAKKEQIKKTYISKNFNWKYWWDLMKKIAIGKKSDSRIVREINRSSKSANFKTEKHYNQRDIGYHSESF